MNKLLPVHILIFVTCLMLAYSCIQKQADGVTEKQDGSIQIKVAAYNVEYSTKGSAVEIGEFLKPYDFDIICFSEAPGGSWTKEVGTMVGLEHVVVGQYSTAGHKDKYKTIASKTPLTNYEEVLMADTFHTATRATTNISGKEVAIYSVHFPFGWRDQAHIDETTGKVTAFVNYLKARHLFILGEVKVKKVYYLELDPSSYLVGIGNKIPEIIKKIKHLEVNRSEFFRLFEDKKVEFSILYEVGKY